MRRVKARKLVREGERVLLATPAIDHWQKHRERIEAEELLEHLMGEMPDDEDRIPDEVAAEFRALIARRATGEPVPYIKGYTDFLGIDLIAEPGVFVPRDSSEFLAIQAIRRLKGRKHPVLVDLATGGGTIALAVKHRVNKADVYGTDVDADAIKLAARNAAHLGLEASFIQGDMFAGLPVAVAGHVNAITLHPPYVPVAEIADLPDEVRAWEPEHTLTDGSVDGMGLVHRTVDEGPRWLSKSGWVLIEVDPDTAREVKRIVKRGGFREVAITQGGELRVTRVVVGRRPA
jgi:release factor glutamine methyltransferase